MDVDHPNAPESIPEDIVELVQNADIQTIDDLGGYIEQELKARANAILEEEQ